MKIYLDGVMKASKTVSTSIAANSRIRLGTHATSGNYFVGDYDEVKVYDVALTAQEIQCEYAAKVAEFDAESGVDEGFRAYGDVTTTDEVLYFKGVTCFELMKPGSLPFAGLYRTYAANVDFGASWAPNAIPSTAKLDVSGGGAFNFFGDAAVAGLSGEGLLGGVNVAEDKTLTVTSDNDAAFAGRLGGAGAVAKRGTGNLTLTGASSVPNVAVGTGTLTVDRAFPYRRKGLVGCWRFEDGAAMGRDLCGNADMELAATTGATMSQLAEGKIGRGISLHKGTTVANAMIAPAGKLPTGTSAFSIMGWVRPKSDSPANAYLFTCRTIGGGHPDGWTGGSWNGWNIRFYSGKLSALFLNGSWANPADNSHCVQGTLPKSGVVKDGLWHHVAVTRDADSNVAVYFDGARLATKKLTEYQNVSSTVRLSFGGQDASNSFSGDYDEVMFFNRMLSADEIAAEYAARKLAAEDDLISAADARWTFDEIAEEDGKKLFKDLGPNHVDFKNTPTGSSYVECVSGVGINGGAAYFKTQGAYLQLNDGVSATSLLQASWPIFTLSIRLKNTALTNLARSPFFCFGNPKTSDGCLRIAYGSAADNDTKPQSLVVLPGSPSSTYKYPIDDAATTSGMDTPWTTITLVNDITTVNGVQTNLMTIYRDGKYVKTVSTAGSYQGTAKTSFNFDLSCFYIGSNTFNPYSGFMVDDLCIFRKQALNAAQVKRLVLEQAGATASPFAASDVTVAENATLAVKDGDHMAKSVAGAGEVAIAPYGTFAADDWSGFTGTVSGTGCLKVSAPLPSGVTVTVDRIQLAASGEVDLGAEPAPGKYLVVPGAHVTAPDGLAGWTVKGLDSDRYRFKLTDAGLVAVVRGGMAIIFL